MNRNFIGCLLYVTAMPLLAAAPQPTDPAEPVSAPAYESAFSNYRPYAEQNVIDWPALNEEVARIGGHGGVVRGGPGQAAHTHANPAQPTGETPSAPAAAPVRGAPSAAAEHGHSSGH